MNKNAKKRIEVIKMYVNGIMVDEETISFDCHVSENKKCNDTSSLDKILISANESIQPSKIPFDSNFKTLDPLIGESSTVEGVIDRVEDAKVGNCGDSSSTPNGDSLDSLTNMVCRGSVEMTDAPLVRASTLCPINGLASPFGYLDGEETPGSIVGLPCNDIIENSDGKDSRSKTEISLQGSDTNDGDSNPPPLKEPNKRGKKKGNTIAIFKNGTVISKRKRKNTSIVLVVPSPKRLENEESAIKIFEMFKNAKDPSTPKCNNAD